MFIKSSKLDDFRSILDWSYSIYYLLEKTRYFVRLKLPLQWEHFDIKNHQSFLEIVIIKNASFIIIICYLERIAH